MVFHVLNRGVRWPAGWPCFRCQTRAAVPLLRSLRRSGAAVGQRREEYGFSADSKVVAHFNVDEAAHAEPRCLDEKNKGILRTLQGLLRTDADRALLYQITGPNAPPAAQLRPLLPLRRSREIRLGLSHLPAWDDNTHCSPNRTVGQREVVPD